MSEKRYVHMFKTIHADETLIEKTLAVRDIRSHPVKSHFSALRLTAGAVICLLAVMLTLTPPPKDVITTSSTAPASTDGFIPLSNQADDQVRLSVGAVTMDSNGVITIPINITGSCIQDLVRLSYSVRDPLLIADNMAYFTYDEAANSRVDIVKRFKLQDGMTLSDLGSTLDITVHNILVAREASTMLHNNLLLSSLPRSIMEHRDVITSIRWWELPTNQKPTPDKIHREELSCLVPGDLYIDLGSEYALTAIGFNEKNELVLQLRLPTSLPRLSTVTAQLVRTDDERITSWLSFEHQGWWDDDVNYCYHEYTTPEIHPDNMDEYKLFTRTESITAWLDDGWEISIPVNEIQIID